ncbi:MAG: cytochrome c maturation protein CcmE [Bacteroidetes bacterium]|jgi:cytochrome c-type biogenesis protein CcmE|nr:cytochrome c maturation protein CcmE [Bacteroidota bacterium]
MKKTHIIAIALIAISIAAILSMYGDASTYEDFTMAAENNGKEYHVVGTLNRTKEKYYDPKKDANFFSFYMIDEKGKESKVVYHNPEPTDFERSEKIVIVGSMEGDHFEASKILLKCPSKYTDNQVKAS